MPRISTKYFGSMEYREEDVVHFPFGFPAFEDELQFLAIERAECAPLRFLQSVRHPGLCFLALPILIIDPDYQLTMTTEDIESLHFDGRSQPAIGEEIECLAILVSPPEGPPTANLLAPVVINRANHIGLQAIRSDFVYSHQHSLAALADVCS